MYGEETAWLPVAPREINDLAVIRIDGDRDSASDALLSSRSRAVDHEGEADPFYHSLSRKPVTGRGGRFLQINKPAAAPFVIAHYDDVGAGNDESVCLEVAGCGAPSVEGCIDRTIRVGHRTTLRTILASRSPLVDPDRIKGRSSDGGVQRLIHRLGFAGGGGEIVVANVDAILTGAHATGRDRRGMSERLIGAR